MIHCTRWGRRCEVVGKVHEAINASVSGKEIQHKMLEAADREMQHETIEVSDRQIRQEMPEASDRETSCDDWGSYRQIRHEVLRCG